MTRLSLLEPTLLALCLAALPACTSLLPGTDVFDAGASGVSDAGPSDGNQGADSAVTDGMSGDAEPSDSQPSDAADAGPTDTGPQGDAGPVVLRGGVVSTGGAGANGFELRAHGFERALESCSDAGSPCVRGGLAP